MFLAIKTEDGSVKKISFYCKRLGVIRQNFHNYSKYKGNPWKYQSLKDAMLDICAEEECNDTYCRIRINHALEQKKSNGVNIPSERTAYRVMKEIDISHRLKRKPIGIT